MTIEELMRLLSGGGDSTTQTLEATQTPAILSNPTAQGATPQQGVLATPVNTPNLPVGTPLPTLGEPQKGILEKAGGYLNQQFGFDQPDFLSRLSNGLAVAGSQDPFKALMSLRAQEAENAKIAEARRRANQPKVEQISGTPFSRITMPDGSFRDVASEALAAFYKSQSETKAANKRSDMELQADLNVKAAGGKADIKAAEEALPQLKQIQDQVASIQTARETLPRMGALDQLKGAAGGLGDFAASMTDPQMNIDSQRRTAVRTLDWVKSSTDLKGALSNVEGLKLDMPLPKPSASKEEWQAYFDNSEKVLKAAEDYYKKQVGRSPSAAGSISSGPSATPAPTAPAPTDAIRSAVTAAGIAFEPEKYQYRIGPNGQVQRKAK